MTRRVGHTIRDLAWVRVRKRLADELPHQISFSYDINDIDRLAIPLLYGIVNLIIQPIKASIKR